MAKGRKSDDGFGLVVGAFIFVIWLISQIPKEIWIAIGITIGGVALMWLSSKASAAYQTHKAAQDAEAKRQRELAAKRKKEKRIALLGTANAALVDSAESSVKQVLASEAARAGWLGDVDFDPDVAMIEDNFQKACALRDVAAKLSTLDKPTADDRTILAEATSTAVGLECAAAERVKLIGKCATEARLIDDSLRQERKDARTAEQRAELHAKLSAMLYGIEATPETAVGDSAADAVMARVQAYREIRSQIQRARGA